MESIEILYIGSVGPMVYLLQEGLRRANVFTGSIDGIFGNYTKDALIAFQIQENLIADGIFGEASFNALYKYLSGYQVHTINSGDTIFRLATTYNTTVNAIITSNPFVNPYNLVIGQELVIPLGFLVVPTNIPLTSFVLEICIDGLLKRYPFLEVSVIGQSIMQRNLYAIKIGNGENEVMYNASHHANEWITTPILLKFLEEYSKSYSENSTIFNQNANSLYNQTTIYIVPLVNPDGVDLVTNYLDENSFEYQFALELNPSWIEFPSGWKANIRGVDLNLNYPARWLEAREIKFSQDFVNPGPRDYVGPNPLSEPESIALALFTLQHHFRLTLSYHTQGEVIYWKFADFEPVNSFAIAQRFSEVSGYIASFTPSVSANAGYKDWFIQTYNLPGYTIEAGRGTNPLPISDFDSIYQRNIGILVLGALLAF